MSKPTPILEFASRGAARAAAVTGVVESLAQALAGRGRASLGVCGGRTAAAMLPVLATQLIDWEHVDVFLVDERWVDPIDDQSNEKLVRTTLLQGPAAAARFTGLKSTHHSARQAAPNIEARLQAIARPFDVVFLGMGNDGHIASLFPGGAENSVTDRLVTASTAPAGTRERISLTPAALQQVRRIVLVLFGRTKRALLEQAITQGSPVELPVRHVLQQQGPELSIITAGGGDA
ncbi:MAG TPA: 6-phosphogluconolactonase [Gammaproteobacteria bacterium]|jgi:6-phosphogluconolactonase|nr:6-phosphogluconolactonase [Gammaproteobacteria bacterium]|tara:strand:+ start:181 stop:882 length:702 start_codon:yes stop_codon:yes gene_type:complete